MSDELIKQLIISFGITILHQILLLFFILGFFGIGSYGNLVVPFAVFLSIFMLPISLFVVLTIPMEVKRGNLHKLNLLAVIAPLIYLGGAIYIYIIG